MVSPNKVKQPPDTTAPDSPIEPEEESPQSPHQEWSKDRPSRRETKRTLKDSQRSWGQDLGRGNHNKFWHTIHLLGQGFRGLESETGERKYQLAKQETRIKSWEL